MFWWRLTIKSISCGFAITIIASSVAFLVGNETVSKIFLPPMAPLTHLLAPPILFGHDYQGNPVYEGNSIYPFVIFVVLLICIPFYSVISFLALLILNKLKSNNRVV
jgi:hypothetical protein